jgi:hypothetical protein
MLKGGLARQVLRKDCARTGEVLPDVDPERTGVNELEPFFDFVRAVDSNRPRLVGDRCHRCRGGGHPTPLAPMDPGQAVLRRWGQGRLRRRIGRCE